MTIQVGEVVVQNYYPHYPFIFHPFLIRIIQDVWARWCGGDGAPAWTLSKVKIKNEIRKVVVYIHICRFVCVCLCVCVCVG
jgi:hypothetical protein